MLQNLDPVSVAASKLQDMIREGAYSPGDRLPPERELMQRMQLSRGRLRQALKDLERAGTIWRHVGKGTFVAPGAMPGGDETVKVARRLTPVRMMQARLCLEPALAREAAVHASAEAIALIERALDEARAAPNWTAYEAQDDRFHRAIAQGSDNALLLALFDDLNKARRAVTWGAVTRRNARPPANHSSFTEHEMIRAAIAARDPEGAWQAMRDHLKSVSERLFP